MTNSVTIPNEIVTAAKLLCKRFCINGLCDEMYICNLIASTSKNGDGRGNFNENPVITNYTEIARRIQCAYASIITYADCAEVAYIMENLCIVPVFAISPLKQAEERTAKEMSSTTDVLRKVYLQQRLQNMRQLRLELEQEVA